MVNPGGSSQPPPVGTGSLSWKRCAGCGGKIADRFLLYTMDSYWHSRCLKCSCCQAQLGEIGTSCYTKSGMILCRNDYIRLFGNSGACSACGQSIPASELVMRAQGNVYHLKVNSPLVNGCLCVSFPAVFHLFHLPEPAQSRGSVSLHQRQPVLRTRQTHSTHQRPFEFAADEPTTARPEGVLDGEPCRKQDVCLHLSPYSLSPKTAWISSTPRPFAPKGTLYPS
ncbi:hypothetical protein PFLUV_G00113150 [Perca fluviatilis]|uniref:LIM zinc-binding domain-containing protein n=1 Tax=Perca fluviatilis TaxID=8168 RepID=A0A6A5EV80_PERFL|nr:hypothetical protein PFLUV_G00113150 [Perca fluviatilis]